VLPVALPERWLRMPFALEKSAGQYLSPSELNATENPTLSAIKFTLRFVYQVKLGMFPHYISLTYISSEAVTPNPAYSAVPRSLSSPPDSLR
jgi:hypothetical protein